MPGDTSSEPRRNPPRSVIVSFFVVALIQTFVIDEVLHVRAWWLRILAHIGGGVGLVSIVLAVTWVDRRIKSR